MGMDTVDKVVETTQEATQEATQQVAQQATGELASVVSYIRYHMTDIIGFGIKVVMALIVFIIGRLMINWIRKIIRHMMERGNVETGVCQFVDSVVKYILIALLILSIAVKFGLDTTSVAAVVASAGVAVGLALQGSLSNFAGGILILFSKPFSVGDLIVEGTNGNEGIVEEIQIFYTKIATLDNQMVMIPNGMLTNNTIRNVTKNSERRIELKVCIAYESDLILAKQILQDLMIFDDRILTSREQVAYVDELGSDGVILGMRCWVKTADFLDTKWSLTEAVKLSFDENGIEIPYHKVEITKLGSFRQEEKTEGIQSVD